MAEQILIDEGRKVVSALIEKGIKLVFASIMPILKFSNNFFVLTLFMP